MKYTVIMSGSHYILKIAEPKVGKKLHIGTTEFLGGILDPKSTIIKIDTVKEAADEFGSVMGIYLFRMKGSVISYMAHCGEMGGARVYPGWD